MNAQSHSVSIPAFEPGHILTSARAFLNLLSIEFRRSQGFWLLPIMLVIGVYSPSMDHFPQRVFWPEVGIAIMESYVQIGAFAATIGAWLAGRERRRRIDALLDSTPGNGAQRDLIAVFCAAAWGLLAYLGVAAWFLTMGVLKATWGGPDWRPIAIGGAAVIAFAALGVLVGRLTPGRYSPLVAFVLAFGLVIASQSFIVDNRSGATRFPMQLLFPTGDPFIFDGDVFLQRVEPLDTGILPWFLALTLALVAALALTRLRSTATVAALSVTVILAGTFAIPLMYRNLDWQPEAYEPRVWTPVCSTVGGIETCLHPAYSTDLDVTAVAISEVLQPVIGLPGVPMSWNQADRFHNTGEWTTPGSFWEVARYNIDADVIGSLFSHTQPSPQRPASQIVIMTWLWLNVNEFRANHAFEDGMLDMFGIPSEVSVSEVVVEEDGMAIMGGPQGDPAQMAALAPKMQAALDRFVALDPAAQRAWLEANWTALVAGEISLDEMP